MKIDTLGGFKERVQAGFDNNEKTLQKYGKYVSTQLKAYLIEVNQNKLDHISCPAGIWRSLDKGDWYVNVDDNEPKYSYSFFLDKNDERVWRIYSILDATTSDDLVDHWVQNNRGLDHCWLTRDMLMHWKKFESWEKKGIGIRFEDGLSDELNRGRFSLKAWHGAYDSISGLEEIMEKAEEEFAIRSMRWQKKSAGDIVITSEWYNNGKITINGAYDVDEALASVVEVALEYSDALKFATQERDRKMTAFELDFTREINPDRFTEVVSKGTGNMRLWLVEKEREEDYRRFAGVDLHTWDRVLVGLGRDFAHLTIPREGCVNAAPRLATLQGEDNSGKTNIYFDGVEIFA